MYFHCWLQSSGVQTACAPLEMTWSVRRIEINTVYTVKQLTTSVKKATSFRTYRAWELKPPHYFSTLTKQRNVRIWKEDKKRRLSFQKWTSEWKWPFDWTLAKCHHASIYCSFYLIFVAALTINQVHTRFYHSDSLSVYLTIYLFIYLYCVGIEQHNWVSFYSLL